METVAVVGSVIGVVLGLIVLAGAYLISGRVEVVADRMEARERAEGGAPAKDRRAA